MCWFGGRGILLTMAIDPTGSIGPILDTEAFDPDYCENPDLFHISGNVYAIAYRGPDVDGWLKTITINPGGTISPVIAELEFDPTLGDYCSVVPVGADIWAIAYYGPGGFAHIQTIQIETTGSITGQIDAATYNPPTTPPLPIRTTITTGPGSRPPRSPVPCLGRPEKPPE